MSSGAKCRQPPQSPGPVQKTRSPVIFHVRTLLQMQLLRSKRNIVAALLALCPSLALAHGEQILLLPLGQLLALVACGVLARACAPKGKALIIWLIALGVCICTWFLPLSMQQALMGSHVPPSESRIFAIGFLAPSLAVFLGIMVAHRLSRPVQRHKP